VASFGVADVLLTGGAFDLGQAELDSITLPSITPDTAGLVGQVTALHATAARLKEPSRWAATCICWCPTVR
jgi:hypothetical protein